MEKEERLLIKLGQDLLVEDMEVTPGVYPVHYHDHFEMELVIDGSGKQLFNDSYFDLARGNLFLVRPLDYHKLYSNGLEFTHVKVKENVLPKWILKRIHALKNPVVYKLNDEQFETFYRLMKLLQKEIENEKNDMLNASSTLLELIYIYFFKLDDKSQDDKDADFVSKIIYFLQKNNRFTQKVTLDEIANYVGYSKFYTSSMFHKKYGMTIQDFILYLRVEYAKKLLVQSNYSITEIILECGFSSTSNFYSKFIKLVGCSPNKFKQKARQENEEQQA